MLSYLTVNEIAKKWGLADRQVRIMCSQGKIKGAYKSGRAWLIPDDSVYPADGRTLRFSVSKCKSDLDFSKIDELKKKLDNIRPLTQGEV